MRVSEREVCPISGDHSEVYVEERAIRKKGRRAEAQMEEDDTGALTAAPSARAGRTHSSAACRNAPDAPMRTVRTAI